MEKITKSLLPFLIVTAFIVMAFAHMFHIAGPPSGIYCPASTMEKLENIEYQAGGWTCQLKDSYFQSFAMLLSGDFLFFEKPNGKWSALTFIFAIVIGIVMLNVLIAIVNDSLMENQKRSQDGFWLGRLEFLCSIKDILRFISSTHNNSIENDEMRVLKVLFNGSTKPSRRVFSYADKRDIKEWGNNSICLKLLYWFERGLIGEESQMPLWQRIRAFLQVAVWNEIISIPPSLGMVKVIAGVHRREAMTASQKLRAQFLCYLIFILVVIFTPFVFIAGLISAGQSWPHDFKAFLFFGPVAENNKEVEFERNGIVRSENVIASDLKLVVERITEQQNKLRDEVHEIKDEMDKNHAELLAFLHEIKKESFDC